MININIVRKGFAKIPDEAKKCPICGKIEQYYSLENLHYANPVYNNCQCNITDFVQKYPTFHCDKCQTIWQYLGEKEEEKIVMETSPIDFDRYKEKVIVELLKEIKKKMQWLTG